MLSSHSYLPNDRDFSVIEKKRKRAGQLYVPEDWMNLVASSSKAFTVIKMTSDDFFDTSAMREVCVNRKRAVDGEDVG